MHGFVYGRGVQGKQERRNAMLDKRKRGLSILFSALLAASLVPAPALAEMVDAPDSSEGEALVDQNQDPLDEQNATSSQEGDEGVAQGDGESPEAQQDNEESPDDVVPNEQAESDGQAEQEAVEDTATPVEEHSIEAQTDLSSQSVAGELTLNVPVEVSLDEDEECVYSFTAPEDGTYTFQSEGANGEYEDTYGELYADSELTDLIDSDDDGAGEGGFKINCTLDEGQTVYLRAYGYSHNEASFSITADMLDTSDLVNGDIYISGYKTSFLVGQLPSIIVTNYDGDELEEGVDYELEYYDEDEEEYLDGGPTDAGNYSVRAVALDSGEYTGQTSWCGFTLVQVNDLSAATLELDTDEFEVSSRAVVLNERVVDAEGKTLKAGTHYTLEYYDDDNEEELGGAPKAIGYYKVRAVAKVGGGYTGSTSWEYFDIKDSYDISRSWVNLLDYSYYDDDYLPTYQYRNGVVKPSARVEIYNISSQQYIELVEGVDYTISYANNTRPTAYGDSAIVTVTGKGKYHGSREVQFLIVAKLNLMEYFNTHAATLRHNGVERDVYYDGEPGDVNGATFLASEEGVTPEVVFGGDSVVPKVGVDYTVSYINDDGVSISTPREVGYYAAVVRSTGNTYEGSVTLPFELVATKSVGRDAKFTLDYKGDVEQKNNRALNVYSTFDVVKGIGVTISDGMKALQEGVDYTVQKIVDDVNGFIKFIFSGTGKYEDTVSAYVYAKGVRPMDISNAEVTVAKTSYTGKAQTPRVTVKATGGRTVRGTVYTVGTFTLVEGTDYTVKYGNNVNAGNKATVTISALESAGLVGTVTKNFTIDKAASSISLSAQNATYTGKAIAYKGTVKRSGSTGAVTFKYYSDAACKKEVSAANVKAAGVYYVRGFLAADANYGAAVSNVAKLTIAKAANPMKVSAVKRTAKAATVQSKKQTVAAPLKFKKKAVGKVTYARVAKGSAKCLTVNKKNGKVIVAKGTKKGTYKVKVKVTAAGNGNYKKASKTIACEVVVK